MKQGLLFGIGAPTQTILLIAATNATTLTNNA
jgi:hypothetical protein